MPSTNDSNDFEAISSSAPSIFNHCYCLEFNIGTLLVTFEEYFFESSIWNGVLRTNFPFDWCFDDFFLDRSHVDFDWDFYDWLIDEYVSKYFLSLFKVTSDGA